MIKIFRYNVINPYRRDWKNKEVLYVWFQKLIDNCVDETSVCKQVFKLEEYTFDEMFQDLVTIVVAGTETTSRTIISILYYLKKNPDKLELTVKDLKDHGFDKNFDFSKLDVEQILTLEYLPLSIKEGLRVDSPVVEVFNYYTYDNITICNVDIPKGSYIKLDLYSGHYNENDWLNPKDFIPERHDPDSEYFKKSVAEGKKPHTYSRRSFGHGKRACPGQTLAILKIKIVLTYMLSNFSYDVCDGLLENDGAGFGAGSLIEPMFKINKL